MYYILLLKLWELKVFFQKWSLGESWIYTFPASESNCRTAEDNLSRQGSWGAGSNLKGGLTWRALRPSGTLLRVERLLLEGYCPEEKMFGFHKPKMYRSIKGCWAKSSSSRFTDSKRYEKDYQSCLGLHETRSGDICNACVLLVKRWKKLPAGSKKNWNHVSLSFPLFQLYLCYI